MTAVFPGGVKSFTIKVDSVDKVMASHVNDIQNEVAAIETYLVDRRYPHGITQSIWSSASVGILSEIHTYFGFTSTHGLLDATIQVPGYGMIVILSDSIILWDIVGDVPADVSYVVLHCQADYPM